MYPVNVVVCNNYHITLIPTISTYLQVPSSHHKAQGRQISWTQQNSGIRQYNSLLWSCHYHQSHLHNWPAKVHSLLSNYQCFPNPSFRTHPGIICNTHGNFRHCPHHYQGLHFCHLAHVLVSRSTHRV